MKVDGGGHAEVDVCGETKIVIERSSGEVYIGLTTTSDGRIGVGATLDPREARELGEKVITRAVLAEDDSDGGQNSNSESGRTKLSLMVS